MENPEALQARKFKFFSLVEKVGYLDETDLPLLHSDWTRVSPSTQEFLKDYVKALEDDGVKGDTFDEGIFYYANNSWICKDTDGNFYHHYQDSNEEIMEDLNW